MKFSDLDSKDIHSVTIFFTHRGEILTQFALKASEKVLE